jgi:hypothetical protein
VSTGDTDSVPPLVDFAPLQPPEAVQLVAPLTVHASVELFPRPIRAGVAVSVTSGGFTTTVVVRVTVPPGPEHWIVYEVVFAGETDSEPPVADLAPAQPPEALQVVALVTVQFRFDDPPGLIGLGDGVIVTVGAGGPATKAEQIAIPSGRSIEKVKPLGGTLTE